MNREKIIEDMAMAIKKTPLNISSTRRSGSNGLRNAEEVAEVALNASGLFERIEDLTGTLEHLKHLLPDHPCEDCESIIDNALKTNNTRAE